MILKVEMPGARMGWQKRSLGQVCLWCLKSTRQMFWSTFKKSQCCQNQNHYQVIDIQLISLSDTACGPVFIGNWATFCAFRHCCWLLLRKLAARSQLSLPHTPSNQESASRWYHSFLTPAPYLKLQGWPCNLLSEAEQFWEKMRVVLIITPGPQV